MILRSSFFICSSLSVLFFHFLCVFSKHLFCQRSKKKSKTRNFPLFRTSFFFYLAMDRCLFIAATSCGRGDCMSLLKGFGVKLIYNIGVTITVRDYRQICIAIEIIEIVITQIAIMQIILQMLSL